MTYLKALPTSNTHHIPPFLQQLPAPFHSQVTHSI